MIIFTLPIELKLKAKMLLILVFIASSAYSQSKGKKIFNTVCRACHTIGQGKLVGPDLENITDKQSEEWIIKFVKSSQALIKSGDAEAIKIFNEYNKMVMPDQPYSDVEIKSIIKFIMKESKSGDTADKIKSPASISFNLDSAGMDEYIVGLKYFSGEKRLENGGPACISCHNVNDKNLIGGGLLSKDLTNVFTRVNPAGINAILSSPPFPVMRKAFENKKITKYERNYLLAFFKQTNLDSNKKNLVNYKLKFVYSGFIGLAILLVFFGFIWTRRKKSTVKKEIYNR